MVTTMELPHALEGFDTLMAPLPSLDASSELLLALDFDGTLAAIAPRPEDAVLPEGTGAAIAALVARGVAVAVISGRGLDDVRDKVGLEGIVYAGSHGFEIAGVGQDYLHPAAAEMDVLLPRVAAEIEERLTGVDGAQLERKRVSLAVHDRRVSSAEGRARVAAISQQTAERHGLRYKSGKRIHELGPDVDWHKGRALARIAGDRAAIYLGDDVTDEDAFAVLAERRGRGIVVSTETRETAASWRLSDPAEVATFLGRLAAR